MPSLPPEIFKAYDIRGVVGRTLTPDIVRTIGHALGSLARERARKAIAIGRDGRLSGPSLSQALSDGIRASGIDVIDIGMVVTPMTYYASHELGTASSVMVTGSHNPPDYNGLKMVIDGTTLSATRYPGAARAHCAEPFHARRGRLSHARHRSCLSWPHHARRQPRATASHRSRLRQRCGRCVCA